MKRIAPSSWRSRAASLALAGALALSAGAVTAGLAPTVAHADDGTVTITQKANPDAAYDAYRLFTADIDDEGSAANIQWDALVTAEKQTALVDFLDTGGAYTKWLSEKGIAATGGSKKAPQNVLEYISSQIGQSQGVNNPVWVNADSFAMSLANWAKTYLTKVGTATQGQVYTAPEGYYLFLTTPGTLGSTGTTDVATAPIWLPLGGAAKTVHEKASPVTITKQVQEDSSSTWQDYADAAIGQHVPYKIEVGLPGNYNAYDTFYAQLTDTLPKGMTLASNDSSQKYGVKVYVDTVGGTDITDNFTVVYDDAAKKLTVTCGDTTAISNLSTNNKIVVWYEAELVEVSGSDVVYGGNGNTNTATFTFSNDPNSDTKGTTNEVDAKLYTYFVTVDKLDKATQQTLEGAQFVIQDESNKFLKDGEWVEGQNNAQVFETDKNGAISGIKGLDAGKYTLIETKAPNGYELPANPRVGITVTPAYDNTGKLTGLTATIDGTIVSGDSVTGNATEGSINIDVLNDKNLSLAMTGAEGVGLGGAAVLAIGLGWYLVRRHRQSATQE